MSKEAVLKIRETEAEAQAIITDANERAARMLSDAEERAKDELASCESETEREFAEKVNEVRAGAEALVEKDRAQTDREASRMIRTADANLEGAANLIVRRLAAECQ